VPVLASLLIGMVGGVGYQLWSLERQRPGAQPAAKVEATDQSPVSATAVAPPAPRKPDASGRAVVPPAAVHQVQPTIPDGIRSRLTAEVVIPVEVRVNERGKVLRAHVTEEGGDGVHRYLAEQAERAAREWQFNPARTQGGEPVAATKTIEFVFTP
jgi:TonB family protein